MVASKGLRPANSFHCLMFFGGTCDLARRRSCGERHTGLFAAGILGRGDCCNRQFCATSSTTRRRRSLGATAAAFADPRGSGEHLRRTVFAWCILLLTLAVSYEVFSRYVLGAPTDWAFDASYIPLWHAVHHGGRLCALAQRPCARRLPLPRPGSPKPRRRWTWPSISCSFFPGIIAFIYSGYGFAAQSWVTHEHSAYSPAGPPIYHYKTLIPVTGVFLLLQGVVEVVRCLICLRTGDWPQRLHDVEELEKVILEQHADAEAKP